MGDTSGTGLNRWVHSFDCAMGSEVLRSERARVTIIASVLSILLVVVWALVAIPGAISRTQYETFRQSLPLASFIALGAIGYELAVRIFISRHLKRGTVPRRAFYYVSAFIEVSVPTAIMMVIAASYGKLQSLHSPMILLFLFIVVLSTLHLDFWLCVYTGIIASVEYAVLAQWWITTSEPIVGAEYFSEAHQHVLKGVLLATSGLVSGFVAVRIRAQITSSLQRLEERNRAVSVFGQHVSPEVADLLLKQPDELGAETRSVCIMFFDIRDFSAIAKASAPIEVMNYLNTVFDFVIRVVNGKRGIVNKFLGDGFMAVFGNHVGHDRYCDHATSAAIEILQGIERLNAEKAIPHTRVGIGLHVGDVVSGNVGSRERKEYTIIGDAVNVASRIEQATKRFGTPLLVSDDVWRRLDGRGFLGEELGPVELKGQPEPLRIVAIAAPQQR